MKSESSLYERARTKSAAPLRFMGRLAVEHLSFGFLVRNNRYDQHLRELRRALGNIETHHAEHHLLRRFIAELPHTFTQPWNERGQVEVIDTLEVRAGVRHDNIMLLTEHLLGVKLTDAEVVSRARRAEQVTGDRVEATCRLAALNHRDFAWVKQENRSGQPVKVQEYIAPTNIEGLVMGFSGPAITGSDSANAEFSLRFYSVPTDK